VHYSVNGITHGCYRNPYTNDREKLGETLDHDVSHRSAFTPEQKPEQTIAPQQEMDQAPRQERAPGMDTGLA
jgi:hypothetical protein